LSFNASCPPSGQTLKSPDSDPAPPRPVKPKPDLTYIRPLLPSRLPKKLRPRTEPPTASAHTARHVATGRQCQHQPGQAGDCQWTIIIVAITVSMIIVTSTGKLPKKNCSALSLGRGLVHRDGVPRPGSRSLSASGPGGQGPKRELRFHLTKVASLRGGRRAASGPARPTWPAHWPGTPSPSQWQTRARQRRWAPADNTAAYLRVPGGSGGFTNGDAYTSDPT
jgi:hypothetical protein